MKVFIYARTSGDEADTGQDVRAQLAQTAAAFLAAGHEVLGSAFDDGVSGSQPASMRAGWRRAVAMAAQAGAAVAVREISRFSRFRPAHAMLELEKLPCPVLSLKESHFTTSPNEDPSVVLLRFVSLWQAWSELQGIQTKTQAAMDELTSGRRATKSGNPVGRPKVIVAPEHLAACRPVLEAEGLLAAHRHVLKLRGYHDVVDPEAKKRRYVSREAFATQMGLRPAKNPDPSKTPGDQEGELPTANGPVVDRPKSVPKEPQGQSVDSTDEGAAPGGGGLGQ